MQLIFVYPWLFLLLPLPWLITHFFSTTQQDSVQALRVPYFNFITELQRQIKPARPSQARKYLHPASILLWLAWLCLLIAAARPVQLGAWLNQPRSGRNILLAVDISGSMQIADMIWRDQALDRLTMTKKILSKFIASRQGDRIGIILFGSKAYLQAPLTFDTQTAEYLLDDASIGLAGTQTALGDAMALAIKNLLRLPAKQRVLVLLTDGQSNSGNAQPLAMAELAAKHGIRIYTIGLGSDQMVLQSIFGSQAVDPSLELDEATLKQIAQITGAIYFRGKDGVGLAQIYQQIDNLEPITVDQHTLREQVPLHHYFILFALLLLFSYYLTSFLNGSARDRWQGVILALGKRKRILL